MGLLFTDISGYDMVFAGFAPQLVIPLFRRGSEKPLVIDFFISMYDTLCFDRKSSVREHSGRILRYIDKRLSPPQTWQYAMQGPRPVLLRRVRLPDDKMKVLYLEADTSIYYPVRLLSTRTSQCSTSAVCSLFRELTSY